MKLFNGVCVFIRILPNLSKRSKQIFSELLKIDNFCHFINSCLFWYRFLSSNSTFSSSRSIWKELRADCNFCFSFLLQLEHGYWVLLLNIHSICTDVFLSWINTNDDNGKCIRLLYIQQMFQLPETRTSSYMFSSYLHSWNIFPFWDFFT